MESMIEVCWIRVAELKRDFRDRRGRVFQFVFCQVEFGLVEQVIKTGAMALQAALQSTFGKFCHLGNIIELAIFITDENTDELQNGQDKISIDIILIYRIFYIWYFNIDWQF